MQTSPIKLPFPAVHAWVLPLLAFLGGLLLWVIDAAIDVFLLGEEQTFIDNILTPELSELWMRLLVVIVLLGVGISAHVLLKKHIMLDNYLFEYQHRLEQIVAEKTADLEIKNQELEALAHRDSLTRLFNRRRFQEVVEFEIERYARHDGHFSLLVIDIDDFKRINDQFGHDVGDEVIQLMAMKLREHSRKSDCVARWGGEEFVLLMVETDGSGAAVQANHLCDFIRLLPMGRTGPVTVSIGVAEFRQGETFESLFKRADEALYRAKAAGKDRVEMEIAAQA